MSAPLTRVDLTFIPQRVNHWLRFGQPLRESVRDRWRRIALFVPGAVLCRVLWEANEYGTTRWQLGVLQAGDTGQTLQRMSGVLPGAVRLLHVSGEPKVQQVLRLIDTIEALGFAPADAAPAYWRTVHNRLSVHQPPPIYSPERHAAHLAAAPLR